jgi:hypothetical protein
MTDRFSTVQNGLDPRAQALGGAYMRAGYAQIDPPLLQPAEPFLDLSGEDIRRRMFLTSDPQGRRTRPPSAQSSLGRASEDDPSGKDTVRLRIMPALKIGPSTIIL